MAHRIFMIRNPFRFLVLDISGYSNPYTILMISKSARDEYLKWYGCAKKKKGWAGEMVRFSKRNKTAPEDRNVAH